MSRIYINKTVGKIGEEVKVAGWIYGRRDHGKLIFIDLIDASGILQAVFTPDDQELLKLADTLRPNDVVEIKGMIAERPKNMFNEDLDTGNVELKVKSLNILNKSETAPFELNTDGYEVNEEMRLKYRYLDLRRKRLHENLKARHGIIKFIRDYLTEKDFVEIETPVLTKSTPEGARDYVVPSRLQQGKFYALPQSPQQYKQLLMVAGFEKYFQIPRCFRDEDTRGDRQPEFTQLDIEMSFVEQEDILNLTEDLMNGLAELVGRKATWRQLTYNEAMEKYKTDKPDLRKDKDELAFCWVTDFPAFENREEGWHAVHHPFTLLKAESIEEIKKDPAKILAHQYDLVLNGYETGGGSLRIHKPEFLEAVFELLGHSKKETKNQFGHLLDAFKYGAPPHGGIALGLDRIIMILQNEPNIREIIAFPKTGDGRDLMIDAPSEISKKQLKELGISIKKDVD
jgi:aspartyl-tRNA synthetase